MADRPKISAFVVCFNEADKIEACLRSLDWVDELVVVDSFSTDRTPEIARDLAHQFHQRDWKGYRDQKNWAMEQCSHDWVLYLDADERVSPELKEEILTFAVDPGDHVAARMPRKTFYLGRWIRHGGWYPDYCTRLFRKDRGEFTGTDPHEYWKPNGPMKTLGKALVHYTYRNLSDQIRTIDRFSDASAAELLRKGKTGSLFLKMYVRPGLKFLSCYFLKGGFRDGMPGFIIAMNSAFYVFNRYAKLWEWSRLKRTDFPDDFPFVEPPSREP